MLLSFTAWLHPSPFNELIHSISHSPCQLQDYAVLNEMTV